jgi:hypothetical protein
MKTKLGATLFAAAGVAAMMAAPAGAANLSMFNHESYWENRTGKECTKYSGYDGMRDVTAYGYLVIVKGGNGFMTYRGGGEDLEAPLAGKSGKAADVSWWMVCGPNGSTGPS